MIQLCHFYDLNRWVFIMTSCPFRHFLVQVFQSVIYLIISISINASYSYAYSQFHTVSRGIWADVGLRGRASLAFRQDFRAWHSHSDVALAHRLLQIEPSWRWPLVQDLRAQKAPFQKGRGKGLKILVARLPWSVFRKIHRKAHRGHS